MCYGVRRHSDGEGPECKRKGQKLFPQLQQCLLRASVHEIWKKLDRKKGNHHQLTLEERWKGADYKHQKDGNDTSRNPSKGQSKEVAAISTITIEVASKG